METPLYIALKVREQTIECCEPVPGLAARRMTVISLPGLVVVSKDALSAPHKGKAILVGVDGARQGLWHLPDDDLREGDIRVSDAVPDEQRGLHRLQVWPTPGALSMHPTLPEHQSGSL
jgi:hypothetical protein